MTPKQAVTTPLAAPQANIGLDADARQEVCDLLNRALADEFVLYVKTRNYHWNVTGPHFAGMHRLFQEQYETIDESLDVIAERVRALGGWAVGSLAGYVDRTGLEEQTKFDLPFQAMLEDLMSSHESVIRNIRGVLQRCEEHHDGGTKNLLEDLIAKHEKMAWMLAATHAGSEAA